MAAAPLPAIVVEDVSKSFRVPRKERNRGIAAWLQHPLGGRESARLRVLDGVSFEVGQGEFFGVVGRNGSGKSTLLKLLASVYRADSGRIRIAGRLAPFLELGVGFNQQLPAYENVILNGVMMGLTPQQAEARFERIIDFAGLGEFTELRLKNYSSGMKVRLAFAVMIQVDADLLLLDEVLAVGDQEFQQKCDAEFERMRSEGRTVILVTHAMSRVTTYCDRAMLIHDGVVDSIGDPHQISNRYLQVNLEAAAASGGDETGVASRWAEAMNDPPVRIVSCELTTAGGEPRSEFSAEDAIGVLMEVAIDRPTGPLGLRLRLDDPQGRLIFSGGAEDLDLDPAELAVGSTLRLRATIENRLGAGRFALICGILENQPEGPPIPVTAPTIRPFEVIDGPAETIMNLQTEIRLLEGRSGNG